MKKKPSKNQVKIDLLQQAVVVVMGASIAMTQTKSAKKRAAYCKTLFEGIRLIKAGEPKNLRQALSLMETIR